MKIDISIIIVNFNTGDLLEACINSIYASLHAPSFEIIVVDNNSSDNSLSHMKKYPSVQLIRNTNNMGFSKGNNQGLALVKGRYAFLLNPDTLLYPDTLQLLADFMDQTPQAGAVSPRTFIDPQLPLEVCTIKILTPSRGVAVLSRIPFPGRSAILQKAWRIDTGLWTTTKPYRVEGISGAAFFTRTELLREIGGLDEKFFMGYEDTDLSYEILKRNLVLFIHPKARIIHYFGQAKRHPKAPGPEIYSWRHAPYQFIRKHFSAFKAASFKAVMTFNATVSRCRSLWNSTPPKYCSMTSETTIQWEGSHNSYIFELSNHPHFFDKFGAVLDEPVIVIPERLIRRLSPGWWFWRVYHDICELESGCTASGRIRFQ